ncbi:MAG: hypothetical protein GY906_08820 [bacterium]|nr:hypothetical protein [bacterium]
MTWARLRPWIGIGHRTVFFALALVVTFPVSADRWYEHYARAEDAIDAQQWGHAVTELTEAIQRRGDSGRRVRTYGMKAVPYFPYLKLGIAYHHLDQPRAALQAFETELRIGEIQASADEFAVLEHYQQLAQEALVAAERAVELRVAELVSESLDEGRRLRELGQLDEAAVAVGRAMAADPEHQAAQALLEELRRQIATRDREAEAANRANAKIATARTHIEAGRLGLAAALLQEALVLQPDEGTRRLLETTRDRIAATQTDADQASRVAQSLGQAQQAETEGRLSDALEMIQSVLALDPSNVEAGELQNRILLARRERADRDNITTLSSEAQAHLARGQHEEALSVANRILALDPGDVSALDVVQRAYGEISQQLLGAGVFRNLPPAIRFSDLRRDEPDGRRVQRVEQPELVLTGIVIDRTPVELEFRVGGESVDGVSDYQKIGEWAITEFQLSARLEPGSNILGVTANDEEGLTSSSEYEAIYDRPVIAHPALRGAGVGVIALIVIWVLAQRWRRRRRLLRRRFNPFIAGAPVLDEQLFFGREELIERVLQTVHNNSLLLFGSRRIGKTSIQHQLKRRLSRLEDPDFEFHPVYIDLQGVPEGLFFATVADEIFNELGNLLGEALPEKSPLEREDYGYRQLVADLRSILKQLQASCTKKVKLVLLMDEVDELNAYDPRINQRLRSLFMKSFAEHLAAVVSGVRIRREWDREASPWYNFFEEIEVSAISPVQARKLITQPLRGVFAFERGTVDKIMEITGCVPYRIQKACREIVTRVHEQGRRKIQHEDVDAVLTESDG